MNFRPDGLKTRKENLSVHESNQLLAKTFTSTKYLCVTLQIIEFSLNVISEFAEFRNKKIVELVFEPAASYVRDQDAPIESARHG